MNLSVYTSLFNYSPEKFDLKGAIKNWSKYANEIVIATFPDQFDEIGKVIREPACSKEAGVSKYIKLVKGDTSLDDPLFDGKLKNAALQACSNKVLIQQDFDERIGGEKKHWVNLSENLLRSPLPIGCHISVIDLYKDLDHYKSVGTKWYIHSKEGTRRGVVNFAIRPDGTVDTDKSDTCELINHNGDLFTSTADLRFQMGQSFRQEFPHIIHLGYLDLEKRVENNKFWSKVWSARNGKEVEVAQDLETLEKENEAIPHGLKKEWWL